MTEFCSKNITPDGITGMIFALEGIKNTVVLLNGPMGCKFYHSTTSQFLELRPPLYLPAAKGQEKIPVDYNFLNDWFFRQARVPCTYLDNEDYVYGTSQKVEEGLRYIRENIDFDLIGIVNSPGASLIGDHLQEMCREIMAGYPVVMLESPGYSENFCDGYQKAVLELLEQTALPNWRLDKGKKEDSAQKSVNLLGISIWHRYWEGDLTELKRLFGLCNIKVNCCLGAGCSLEEIRRLPQADLNVVIYPEQGLKTARFLWENCQIPFYLCPGPPVGFRAVTDMFENICQLLKTDVSALQTDCEKARALAWNKIDSVYQMSGLPDGCTFAVEGDSSVVYSYSRFFMEYLGMIPDCLSITGGQSLEMEEKIEKLMEQYKAGAPQKKDILDTTAELVFADANTIAALKTRNHVFCGIEISQPGMGYVDILPKTQLGVTGSLFLIEQVLNGLMSKL